jgi:hypothetical protein
MDRRLLRLVDCADAHVKKKLLFSASPVICVPIADKELGILYEASGNAVRVSGIADVRFGNVVRVPANATVGKELSSASQELPM